MARLERQCYISIGVHWQIPTDESIGEVRQQIAVTMKTLNLARSPRNQCTQGCACCSLEKGRTLALTICRCSSRCNMVGDFASTYMYEYAVDDLNSHGFFAEAV